ncbi:hypothetical protein [Pseudonocardia sp. D17]|jgi:hypothetical protein|uniref:hypothetical protein n=1 Tax=Pseudonocardia sp. D17 TaxID=882661 RepID=UPI000CD0E994|nr:hypothetical protein PSD17_06440 [Pseudonocardia sp. D17]
MSLTLALADHTLHALRVLPAQIPNPGATAPPGADKITQVIGYVKWGAGAAIVLGFFAGVAMFAGGRIADHHRFGRMGAITIFASVGSAFLYAIGYVLLSTIAGNA